MAIPTYETDFDEYLNNRESLLNQPFDVLDVLRGLLSGEISADQLTDGVIGGTSKTAGIEVNTNKTTDETSIQSRNFVTGSTGWQIKSDGSLEANSGTFRGALIANTLDIPDTITASSFHVDNTGNVWWGATVIGSAVAKVLNTGIATFTNVSITGGSVATSTFNGLVAQANLNIANRGWTQTSAFTVTDADTVAWGAGTFTSADGTAYSILAGNTGNMAAKTYIYLDTAVSSTAYQTTTTSTTAVGIGKVLIAVAQNGTGEATFKVLQGQGGENIDAANIVAGSITANEIAASTITGVQISASAIITAGTGNNVGVLDGADATYRIYAGNATPASAPFRVTQAGVMTATAGQYIENFTAGETITSGDVVCLKASYTDFQASHDSQVYQGSANTNYGSEEWFRAGDGPDANQAYRAFIKFVMTSVPTTESILKAELRIKINTKNGSPTYQIIAIPDTDWDESTITWNNQPALSDTIVSKYGCEKSATLGANGTWITYDITQIVRQWKEAVINNYGIGLDTQGNPGDYIAYNSSENATFADCPVLRVWSCDSSDGKVYKADADDYTLSRSIIGIAQAGAATDATVPIQTHGQVTNPSFGSTTGGRFYLSGTAGGYVTSTINLSRVICLGKITSASKAVLNIQDQDILIEKMPSSVISTLGNYYINRDTRYIILQLRTTAAQNYTLIRINRDNSGLDDIYFTEADGSDWRVIWTANYITISCSGGTPVIDGIYCYT